MSSKEFLSSVDSWLQDLQSYTLEQVCKKPSKDRWSLGQVCMHLLLETDYFFNQVRTCARSNDNGNRTKSVEGESMLRNGHFPDDRIEGPPSNLKTPQPKTEGQLISGLKKLRKEIETLEGLISNTDYNGKTAHPGLGYFNAHEWFRFAEMHFRHHLKQKKSIEDFLRANYKYSIRISKDARKVFQSLTKHIPDWWTEDFTGSSRSIHDKFTVRFGPTFKTMKVVELFPGQKVVWECTDTLIDIPELPRNTEWQGTRIVWDIEKEVEYTKLTLTHIGLTPKVACYEICEKGWESFMESL